MPLWVKAILNPAAFGHALRRPKELRKLVRLGSRVCAGCCTVLIESANVAAAALIL